MAYDSAREYGVAKEFLSNTTNPHYYQILKFACLCFERLIYLLGLMFVQVTL